MITSASENSASDSVILLHGLARTSRSMEPLKRHLESGGFRVINLDYPSTKYAIEELADYLDQKISPYKSLNSRLHFVTHSLGGIVLRYYLKKHRLENLGRVVMLSPPNKGSELVDQLKDNILFKSLTGPSGQQLGTEKNSIPNLLGPAEFDLGVIIGNKSFNPVFSQMIPGEDDGKVSVYRSQVEGMKDFLIVPHTHTFIMYSDDVARQIIHFLENGKFNKDHVQEK